MAASSAVACIDRKKTRLFYSQNPAKGGLAELDFLCALHNYVAP